LIAGVYGRTVSRRDLGLLLVLSAIWGSSFLFIKVAVEELEPAVVAFGRVAVGLAVLAPLFLLRGGVRGLHPYVWPLALLGALNNALPFWLLGFAETRIDSGLAGVIQAAAPIFTVVLAARFDPSQAVRGARLVGVGVGFAGVVLLVGVQEGGQLVAALAVLGTALCYAVAVLFAGRTMAGLPPVKVAAGQLAFGLLLLAPFGIAQAPDELPSADVLAAIAALGALGSGVAYLLYFALIARAGAARAILVTYLVPAFALTYGALFLDEPVTASALGGLALVLAGTGLATGALRRRR
jgi:drug/metabolite transporter (DMT)-like permease